MYYKKYHKKSSIKIGSIKLPLLDKISSKEEGKI